MALAAADKGGESTELQLYVRARKDVFVQKAICCGQYWLAALDFVVAKKARIS